MNPGLAFANAFGVRAENSLHIQTGSSHTVSQGMNPGLAFANAFGVRAENSLHIQTGSSHMVSQGMNPGLAFANAFGVRAKNSLHIQTGVLNCRLNVFPKTNGQRANAHASDRRRG